MKLSVVTTLYDSAPYIVEFHERISRSAQELTDDYEIIFVNDGSPDNSLEVAILLQENDTRVKIVDLARNFGHHKAMMTGLDIAKGERIFLIDSDLEEPPELLTRFWNELDEQRCDVVYGVQETRKGGIVERWSGNLFYRFFRFLTGLKLPDNIITARLMTSNYVKALLLHKERELFLAGIWYITGFNQQPLVVRKYNSSKTTYSLRRKISLLVNSVTSFSSAPLKGIFYIGILISVVAGSYVIYLVISKLFFGSTLSGWTSLMASIWLLGGMIISFIGVVGIYLSRIFSEVKQRPYTIIRHVYENKNAE